MYGVKRLGLRFRHYLAQILGLAYFNSYMVLSDARIRGIVKHMDSNIEYVLNCVDDVLVVSNNLNVFIEELIVRCKLEADSPNVHNLFLGVNIESFTFQDQVITHKSRYKT